MKIQIGLIPWKSNACVEVSCTFDPDGAKNRAMFRAEKIGLVGTNPIDFILIIFVVRAHVLFKPRIDMWTFSFKLNYHYFSLVPKKKKR